MTVVVVLITLFGGALFYFWYLSPWFLRTVLRMSLAGSILTLILLVLRPVLRERIPKKGQYRLWKTALAGFLVPVSLFFTIPVSTPLTGAQYAIDAAVIDQLVTGDAVIGEENGQLHYLPGEEQGLGAVHRVFRTWAARALVLPPAISLVMFAVTGIRYRKLSRRLRRSRIPARAGDVAVFEKISPQGRRPALYRSPFVPTPMLTGIRRPVIYLPDRDYTEKQLENILLHELTHYRRGDVAVKWFGVLLTSLHWFNPLAWKARRELNRACELSCDEEVIRNFDTEGKQDYGNTLIEAAAGWNLPGTAGSTAVCEVKMDLKERLTAILRSGRPGRGAVVLSGVLLMLSLCTAAALGASQPGGYINPAGVVSATRMTLDMGNSPEVGVYDLVSLYDAVPALKAEQTMPDAYTGRLVRMLNLCRRTAFEPACMQAVRFRDSSDSWIRLDCADGGHYLFHYWYSNGVSFFHSGQDEHDSLLTRYDADGNPVGTWKLEYDFDEAYRGLRQDGSIEFAPYYSLRAKLICILASLGD